jgi:hypothetical protein
MYIDCSQNRMNLVRVTCASTALFEFHSLTRVHGQSLSRPNLQSMLSRFGRGTVETREDNTNAIDITY